MTHHSVHARAQPDKIAYQMAGSGKAITYRELDELSNQGAQLFRALGLRVGDHVARRWIPPSYFGCRDSRNQSSKPILPSLAPSPGTSDTSFSSAPK